MPEKDKLKKGTIGLGLGLSSQLNQFNRATLSTKTVSLVRNYLR